VLDHDQPHHRHPGQPGSRPWVHHDQKLPIDPDLSPDDPGEPSAEHHPSPGVHRGRQPKVLAAIAVGGFIGAWGRYELQLAWAPGPEHLPWATVVINTSGAFLLGLVLTVLLNQTKTRTYLRPFFCVGVLGAWTTMSSFAVQTDLLVKGAHVAVAVGYVAATVMGGLTMTWTGIVVARRLMGQRSSLWAWR
jgi:fluoride exporter